MTAQRVLLEETLTASVGALIDLLAITKPESFGRATRLKRYAEAAAIGLGLANRWSLAVAAQLSQVGYIIVPETTTARSRRGEALTPQDHALLDQLLPFAEQLVSRIPRFEPVRMILRLQYDRSAAVADDEEGRRSADALRTILAFDAMESSGLPAETAVDRLAAEGTHDPAVLNALWRLFGLPVRRIDAAPKPVTGLTVAAQETLAPAPRQGHDRPVRDPDGRIRIMPLADVSEGMHFARDVVAHNGVLLIARGHQVTASLVQRIANSWSHFAGELEVHMVVARGAVPEPERAGRI